MRVEDSDCPEVFCLWRYEDVSEVSGSSTVTGKPVAYGTYFPGSDTAVLHWPGEYPTTTVHEKGMQGITPIHGHNGATVVVWEDTNAPGTFIIPERVVE